MRLNIENCSKNGEPNHKEWALEELVRNLKEMRDRSNAGDMHAAVTEFFEVFRFSDNQTDPSPVRAAVQAAQPGAVGDGATIAGLESAVGHLSTMVDEQRRLLVEVEQVCGRDAYGIEFEDGDSELIDKVRAHLAATTSAPTPEPMSAPTEAKPAQTTDATQQASGEADDTYPFYELRFIMRVLGHEGNAPRQDWQTAYGMAKEIFKKWHGEKLAALSTPAQQDAVDAWRDVLAERERQKSAEGYTPEHDNSRRHGDMSTAAACYAMMGRYHYPAAGHPPPQWPWDPDSWKPTTYRRNLVKAGALILAEIERLDRAAISAKKGQL